MRPCIVAGRKQNLSRTKDVIVHGARGRRHRLPILGEDRRKQGGGCLRGNVGRWGIILTGDWARQAQWAFARSTPGNLSRQSDVCFSHVCAQCRETLGKSGFAHG